MSAFEDDPDDFLRFVRAAEPSLTGGSFVPRRSYGEYLAARLDEARRASDLPLLRVAGEVVGIGEGAEAVTLALADGRLLVADRVVLAIGNFPPSILPRTATASIGASATRGIRGRRTRSRATAARTCSSSARVVRRRDVALARASTTVAASMQCRGGGCYRSRTECRPRRRCTSTRRKTLPNGPPRRSGRCGGCAARYAARGRRPWTGARSSRPSATTRPCGAA